MGQSLGLGEQRDIFLTELAANGTTTIRSCVEALEAQGNDDEQSAQALDMVVSLLLGIDGGPAIEPVNLSETQARILSRIDRSDWGNADEDIYDSIQWRFCDGWRERRAEIPAWKYYSYETNRAYTASEYGAARDQADGRNKN